MPYRLTLEESKVLAAGQFKNAKGNTECVVFVQEAAAAPNTSLWTQGIQVKTAKAGEIARGTAIATFDENGKYPNNSTGNHAAIYLSHDTIAITVLDQWRKQGAVKQRPIRFNRTDNPSDSNNGDKFYVIEGPQPSP